MKENVLLSYPRSGNHLVRFFVELLSERPTSGCKNNQYDAPIYNVLSLLEADILY